MPSLPPYASQHMREYTEPFRSSEITRIDVFTLDARVKTRFSNYKSRNPGGGTRGEITELSRQSRSRLLFKARNIPDLTSMLTFTYPGEEHAPTATGGDFMQDGKTVKNHLRKIRQALTYRGIYGFWFLEFQKRGAPHFHFIVSGSLDDSQVSKLKKTWFRMVGTHCPHHLDRGLKYETLRKKHAAGAYAAKYSCKDEQKTVPERYRGVGRFWGTFGKVPNSSHTITLQSDKDIHRIHRVARNARKADARAKGYSLKRTSARSHSGSLYNCAPAIRYFLEYLYIIPDNPTEIAVRAPCSRSPACERP